jgi:transcriptional regulator
MYAPPVFREDRVDVMQDLMRAHPFATLITIEDGQLNANHIPFALHIEGGSEFGILRGHVARPNPVWSEFDAAIDALVVFQGAHHYVTPSWYPSKAEHGKVVPTWNYAIVHAQGPLRAVEDPDWLLAHLHTMTDGQETGRDAPWNVDDAPPDYIEKMVRGIVGLEIPITRLDGKWKMSQNRNAADRAGVVAGLAAEGTEAAAEVAGNIPD